MISFEETIGDDFERTDIDELSILQATDLLVDYCLKSPDEESECIVTRMVTGGLFVAVGLTLDERVGATTEDERWVYRMRLARHRIPFRVAEGLEIRLPYGTDLDSETPILNSEEMRQRRAGVFVSFGGGNNHFWQPIELLEPTTPHNYWREPFDLTRNTVGQVDLSLTQETKWRNMVDLGFLLKDVIRIIDPGYIDLIKMQHDTVIDLLDTDSH
ncbi:MAG: hypothetical protein QG628_247 [Patescibacteria group bacterium]|nr:hypothetical protein [Patescibacteria group bacterium]